MKLENARDILADKLRHYDMHIMANDVISGQNTGFIMAALSAMQVTFETGRADAVAEMEAAGIRLLG